MALFKKSESAPEPQPTAQPVPRGSKKATPTPTRREAEAARRQRLNPTLSPKEARQRERERQFETRQRTLSTQEATPERRLLRDVVDSRWNPAEFALPVMLVVLVVSLVPWFAPWYWLTVYVLWAYIAVMVFDTFLMWRRFKALAAERLPHARLKGLLMYGFNRQMSMRRWRQPAPRVQRGETI